MTNTSHEDILATPAYEQINGQVEVLASSIRAYSHSQVEIWSRLPMLALQSEARDGYSDFNRKLYEHGLLELVPSGGLYGTFVDCENGNIVSLIGKPDVDRIASDGKVIGAWLSTGQPLDAECALARLQTSATRPHSKCAFRSEQQAREWRDTRIRVLGLTSIFKRVQPEMV